jgi:hypothetical protein
LIALSSCSDPPEGRERWSMRPLAERMVELGHAEALSHHETLGRTLRKTASSLTSSAGG